MSLNEIQATLPRSLPPELSVLSLAGLVIGRIGFAAAPVNSTSPPGSPAGFAFVNGLMADPLYALRPVVPGDFPFVIDPATGDVTTTAYLRIGAWSAQLLAWGTIRGERVFCILTIGGVVTDAGLPPGDFILGVSDLGGSDLA